MLILVPPVGHSFNNQLSLEQVSESNASLLANNGAGAQWTVTVQHGKALGSVQVPPNQQTCLVCMKSNHGTR